LNREDQKGTKGRRECAKEEIGKESSKESSAGTIAQEKETVGRGCRGRKNRVGVEKTQGNAIY